MGEISHAKQDSKPVHYVLWESLPGGMETYVTYYANRLYGRRELYIFSLRPVGNELDKRLDDAHYTQGSHNNRELYRRYFQYCRAHRGDLFHLLNGGPLILLLTLLAGIRNPVYHIHGTVYWRTFREKMLMKLVWLFTSLFRVRYIANSKHSANMFRKQVLPIQPRVVYNGFMLQTFLDKRWLRTRPRRMAYAGRFHDGKNAHLVIRLFEDVAAEMPELELHLAGRGRLRPELEEQARRSPYADRIIFHGWIDDIAAFYQSMDLFVFLSAYESFGNVVLEALLTGLPVLTSDIPAFKEISGGEPAFCLGDPENYAQILENFRQALADYPALAEKAYNLSEFLVATFDLEKHLNEIEQIYETA